MLNTAWAVPPRIIGAPYGITSPGRPTGLRVMLDVVSSETIYAIVPSGTLYSKGRHIAAKPPPIKYR